MNLPLEPPPSALGVLCVDDNDELCRALERRVTLEPGLSWQGRLARADDLPQVARSRCPAILILDLDMPGRDALAALAEVSESCPGTRAIVFSGLTRSDLVERALDVGAWGYVSKNDGEADLFEAIRRVLAGDVYLSAEPRAAFSAEPEN